MGDWLLFVLLFLAIAWLVVRIRAGKQQATPTVDPESLRETARFHAVSIQYSENGCAAAKALTGHRYLASAAPKLPLPECDAASCHCQFMHHKDRRTGHDRRSPFAARGYSPSGSGSYEKERRDGSDRRSDDN